MTTMEVMADWLLAPALAPDTDDALLRPLYEATGRGELALPFCSSCDLPLDLEQEVCDGCGGLHRAWRTVDLVGEVHTATVMHRREPGLVVTEGPYPIADVELTSGHRLIMTTARPATTAPAIGATVSIAFRRVGDVSVPAVDNTNKELRADQ